MRRSSLLAIPLLVLALVHPSSALLVRVPSTIIGPSIIYYPSTMYTPSLIRLPDEIIFPATVEFPRVLKFPPVVTYPPTVEASGTIVVRPEDIPHLDPLTVKYLLNDDDHFGGSAFGENDDFFRRSRSSSPTVPMRVLPDGRVVPLTAQDREEQSSEHRERLDGVRLEWETYLEEAESALRKFEYTKALDLAQAALRLTKQTTLSENDIARNLDFLALAHHHLGHYARAEALYKRALSLTNDHTIDYAILLHNLGDLYEDQRRYKEAKPLLEKSLTMNERAQGQNHPALSPTLNSLAIVYEAEGRLEDAERLYQRALAIDEQHFGHWHIGVAVTLYNLALLYQTQGRHAKARATLEDSLKIRERLFGPEHPKTLLAKNRLAALIATSDSP